MCLGGEMHNGQEPSTRGMSMTQVELAVEFAKLDPEARLPTQGSAEAAGWDLYALEETTVVRHKSSLIRTGLATAIPSGWEGQIRCRSSLGKKGMIMPNGLGTIDADYRGELMVLATWIGEGDSFVVAKGERVAQMLFAPVPKVTIVETSVEELGTTSRGEGGFGSTGQF
jgi:dUTP pyrophosphatase